MASHERTGLTDEWYTPRWIFEALGMLFKTDPCNNGPGGTPSRDWCMFNFPAGGLEQNWTGSVWLNPPFGGRNGIKPWLEKFAEHDNGIAIVPNRTATDWFQDFTNHASALLFIRGKVKFLRPDGSEGKSPGYGNVLVAYGGQMADALLSSKVNGVRVRPL
jgi:hypothetical protein